MGILNFNFGDIKSAVEEKIDDIKDKAREVLADYFGDKFVKSDISGEGSALRDRQDASRGMMNKVGDKESYAKLASLYKDMWHERYEQFQDRHRANVSVDRPSSHQVYKQNNMGQPAYHNNSNISYQTVTLWTGYFRDVITDAFEQGGNEVLQITNILMTAGFSMDMDQLPRGAGGKNFYKDVFTPWFENEVGLPDPESERFLFDAQRFSDVIGTMIEMFEEGPVEEITKIIRDIEWQI